MAAKFRASQDLSCIQVGHMQHRVSLYADDVILMLTDPEPLLATAHSILRAFSNISYYKRNKSKSLVLGLGVHITDSIKSKLQDTFPFIWSSDSIPYLGIRLCKNVSALFNDNYGHFLSNLPQSLSQLKMTEITTDGKIATFKMLLKLLYLFRALVIPLLIEFSAHFIGEVRDPVARSTSYNFPRGREDCEPLIHMLTMKLLSWTK